MPMSLLLTALLSAAAPLPAPAQAAPKACAADSKLVERKRFTVEVSGKGPDLILIPGLSTPREVWAATCARLSGKYRIHSVQVRGFGDAAGANAQGPVLEPFAQELAAYISSAGMKKPAIIGHSMGGLTAMMIAARHPGLPGKLMAVDALPFIGSLFGPQTNVEIVKPRAESMRQMLLAQAAQPQGGEAASSGGQSATMSNSVEGRASVAKWMRAADLRVVAQAMYDDFTTDLRPEMPKITAPLTLLYPQDESVLTAERAEQTYRTGFDGAKTLKMVRIPQSYHFIMLDQPALFDKEVDSFLAQ